MPQAPTLSKLEKKAQKALSLSAFPINLINIRQVIRSLLTEVGRYGFFDEYTTHSFDHVEDMLLAAEWIIPETTFGCMTSGDALMTVLSIYLHDVGLLISRDEFSHRDQNPDFQKFVANLDAGDNEGKEYAAKLNALTPEMRDRVIYQEFVRATHGDRVRSWIEGVRLDDGGASDAIRTEIHDLLGKLDLTIRKDLGLICDSHTKGGLEDVKVFKRSQPYGNDKQEWVNLQYVAAILSTVDLLQISRRRAPSPLFKVINPVDPVSQLEWQKQGAVRNVRCQERPPLANGDKDTALPDTIEVHADFKEADGFFGLTSFLDYAQHEIQEIHATVANMSYVRDRT